MNEPIEYSTSNDSSEYNSSVVTSNTPFPSMTKSQKVKLNEILHRDPIGYVSTFTHESEGWEVIPEFIHEQPTEEEVKEHEVEPKIKNSCCCLC